MQLAGHGGGEMLHDSALYPHPLTVGARHDVAIGGGDLPGAQQLGLFTAHHAVVPGLFDLETGHNPHVFSDAEQLAARRVDGGGAGQIRHRAPAGVAADHPGHHHRQRPIAAPGRQMLAEYIRRRLPVKPGNPQRQLFRFNALPVAYQPAAQLRGAPVDGNIVLHLRLLSPATYCVCRCPAAVPPGCFPARG